MILKEEEEEEEVEKRKFFPTDHWKADYTL